MRQYKFKIFLAMLLTAVGGIASANDSSTAYGIATHLKDNALHVYKFKDSNGGVTYSSFVQGDSVDVEKIDIAAPPTDADAIETRLRSEQLKIVADQLAEARVKREKIRQEKEKQRLQRLALINQSRPRVYQRNIYAGYPYRYWGTYPGGGHHRPHRPVHQPSAVHRAANLTLPSSSFSSVSHR